MAGLTIYKSQQRAAGSVGGVRADAAALNTGAGAAAARMTQSAAEGLGAVSDVAAKLGEARMLVDLAERTGQREGAYRDTLARLEQEPDLDAHATILGDFEAMVAQLGKGLKGRAADQWKADLGQRGPLYAATLRQVSFTRQRERLTETTRAQAETAIRDKDPVSLSRAYSAAVAGGLMTEEAARNELSKGALMIQQERITETLSGGLLDGSITLKEAMAVLGKPEIELAGADGRTDVVRLPVETRQAMLRDLTYWHAQQQALDAEERAAAQEKDRDWLFDGLNDAVADEAGQRVLFDYGMVQGTSLDEHEKERFWQAFQEKYHAAETAENLRFKISDPATELAVLQAIDLGRAMTTADIYALAGKGLSTEAAKSLSDRLKARDKTPEAARPLMAQQLIKDMELLRKTAYFVGGASDANADDLNNAERTRNTQLFIGLHKEFTRWLDANPTAADSEIMAKYQSLVAPEVETGLWDTVKRRLSTGLIGTLGPAGQIVAGVRIWNDHDAAGVRPAEQDEKEAAWETVLAGVDSQPAQIQSMVDATLRAAGIDSGDGPIFELAEPAGEPATPEEFRATLAAMADEKEARAYYRKWVAKWAN
jgi:hypothetical protein